MPGKRDVLPAVSRRAFLKGIGTTAVATATTGAKSLTEELRKYDAERVLGPGTEALTLEINGKSVPIEVEPSVTLLEVLRDRLTYTGAKEVCDRASCGACTVLLDGKPVYACSTLAVEAQGREITTVEGLASSQRLSTLQEAFIEEDGLQCGYCTSGFLVTLTALLKDNPRPTADQVRQAVSGHLCRCGTYPRVVNSALRAAGLPTENTTEVIRLSHGEKLA